MRSIATFLLVTVLVASALDAGSVHAQPAVQEKPSTAAEEARLARADELYRLGNEHVRAGRLAEAHAAFAEAFVLKRSFDIAGNLADMENELGLYRDAAEHAAYSLKIFPPNGKPRAKERTIEILDRAKKEVCTVRVVATVPGADIYVDDKKIGRAPLGQEIYVAPGARTFRAVAAGHADALVSRDCIKADTLDVSLAPRSLAGGSPPARGSASAPPGAASAEPMAPPATSVSIDAGRPAWPAVVLGAVAAAGLGAGIGFTVAAGETNADATDTFVRCGRSPACEEEAQRGVDRANLYRGIGVAGFALGAASLAGMILYLVIPDADMEDAAVQLIPVMDVDVAGGGVGAGGLSVGGRF